MKKKTVAINHSTRGKIKCSHIHIQIHRHHCESPPWQLRNIYLQRQSDCIKRFSKHLPPINPTEHDVLNIQNLCPCIVSWYTPLCGVVRHIHERMFEHTWFLLSACYPYNVQYTSILVVVPCGLRNPISTSNSTAYGKKTQSWAPWTAMWSAIFEIGLMNSIMNPHILPWTRILFFWF